MTDATKQAHLSNVKAAFTSFPYCIATYVAIFGILWLVLSKWF